MIDTESIQGENLEEADQGQLHAIHLNMNAVASVQRALREQEQQPSRSHCEECGEEIPAARRAAILGVRFCVFCKEQIERA